MARWIDPVFDRSYEDVLLAKEKVREWIETKSTDNLPDTYELKGCLNLTDINRIEGDIQYLSDKLDELYYHTGASCKVWERSGLPTERDIRRILSNVSSIISAYYQQNNVSEVPDSMGNYSDINAIEENLYRIKQLLDAMITSFQKSGMFQSGAMRMLPIRR